MTAEPEASRVTAWVHGHVQGVGFRWWTQEQATALGLVGSATNLSDGTVEVVAEGPTSACQALLSVLRGRRTPGRVSHVVERWSVARGDLTTFRTR
jgi:acylphosphatase